MPDWLGLLVVGGVSSSVLHALWLLSSASTKPSYQESKQATVMAQMGSLWVALQQLDLTNAQAQRTAVSTLPWCLTHWKRAKSVFPKLSFPKKMSCPQQPSKHPNAVFFCKQKMLKRGLNERNPLINDEPSVQQSHEVNENRISMIGWNS